MRFTEEFRLSYIVLSNAHWLCGFTKWELERLQLARVQLTMESAYDGVSTTMGSAALFS